MVKKVSQQYALFLVTPADIESFKQLPIIMEESNSAASRKSKFSSVKSFRVKSHSDIPVIFFKLSYYSALCPFKFTKNEDGIYFVERQIFQKVKSKTTKTFQANCKVFGISVQLLCLFVAVSSLFHRFTETRMIWPRGQELNPLVYFTLFFNIANMSMNIMVWYRLWFNSDKFLNLVRFLHSKESVPDTKLRVAFYLPLRVVYFMHFMQ